MIRIGIFGGGQLAQMLTQAAISLGLELVIFERAANSPAGRYTRHEVVGPWEDASLLARFAAQCDLVSLENEFVDAHILTALESQGLPVYPTAATVALVQDKLTQKQRIAAAGLAVPPLRALNTPDEVSVAAAELGWPLVLKARRNGYDGYGNATLHGPEQIAAAWSRLSAGGSPLMAEAWVPFSRELAVMVARSRSGEERVYPVVETVQRNHICHLVRAPATLSPAEAAAAADLALKAVRAVDGIGIFGVELFELPDGQVLYNEMAPRPHNSGHYTIEGCRTSQFENHLRAILDWPLGLTEMIAPAAVMVNLLGRRSGPISPKVLRPALAIPGAHLHLYGKLEARVGRKLGHVTALGSSLAEAEASACQAADLVAV